MLEALEEHFLGSLSLQDPLLSWKKKFWDRLLEMGWPQDPWIPINTLLIPKPAVSSAELHPKLHQISFVDGFFAGSHLEGGLVCLPLDEAMRSFGIFLQNRISRSLKEETDPFALMNGAFQGRGAFLYAPPGTSAVIELAHLYPTAQMATPRLMVYLGKNAHLKLVQSSQESYFSNAYFEAILDEGATLSFNDAPEWGAQSIAFQSIRASLKRGSRATFRLYSEGAKMHRTSIKVQLLEEGSEALLQGLWRLGEARQNQIHALVEHSAPSTFSRQHFKGVLDGKSRSSFEGKIYVHHNAEKTEAYQINNNLLLSDEALSCSKPNLEIFADDVKASHGATVGELDPEDLFYLRSRGLSLQEARNCLIEGFCRELIDCIPESKR